MLAMLIATLYRIKLERDQVKTVKGNVDAMHKLRNIKEVIEKEKDLILELKDGKEFYKLLKCLFD